MRERPQIAIDGPAGVGKSTIGERVARHLGCLYVDSGAFYRALTVLAVAEQIDPDDDELLAALATSSNIRIVTPTIRDGRQYTVLAGNSDITPILRTLEVEKNVSRVSRHPAVRQALIAQMRAMADDQAVVMVGRDIGTVVLPTADLKIWLTTSIEQRAHRRHSDLVASMGAEAPTLDEVRTEIARRDDKDKAQMQPAPDAYSINNDALTADETVARILTLLHQRSHREAQP
ncbi:MAG TPA: (d)CMP kinase [Ktedonobacterales bacterium]|nr:(d)CMP kinase [Ktedonobacterales bacterium]